MLGFLLRDCLNLYLRGSDPSNFNSKTVNETSRQRYHRVDHLGRIVEVDGTFSRLTRSATHSGQTLLSISNSRGTTAPQERSRCPPLAKANPIRRVSSSILQQGYHVACRQKQDTPEQARHDGASMKEY